MATQVADPKVEAFIAEFLTPWNRHDVDQAMAIMAPDCVWEFPAGGEPWGARFSGAAAVRAEIARFFQTVPDVHFEVVRYFTGDLHITLELLVTGTNPDGTRLNRQACDILVLRDGKVAEKRSYRKVVD